MAYETRWFNATFTGFPTIPIASRINTIPRIDTYLLKIHSNVNQLLKRCIKKLDKVVGPLNVRYC